MFVARPRKKFFVGGTDNEWSAAPARKPEPDAENSVGPSLF
jgi:hypothetical protein